MIIVKYSFKTNDTCKTHKTQNIFLASDEFIKSTNKSRDWRTIAQNVLNSHRTPVHVSSFRDDSTFSFRLIPRHNFTIYGVLSERKNMLFDSTWIYFTATCVVYAAGGGNKGYSNNCAAISSRAFLVCFASRRFALHP